jgi:hypothetical protein
MGAFVPRRDQKAAGRDGVVERSVALDRAHGRRAGGRRKAPAMQSVVRAFHPLLPSHSNIPPGRKSQIASCHYILPLPAMTSTRSSFLFDDRQCHALTEHPHLYSRAQRKPSYDAPPRTRLGACAWGIHGWHRGRRGRAAQEARSEPRA